MKRSTTDRRRRRLSPLRLAVDGVMVVSLVAAVAAAGASVAQARSAPVAFTAQVTSGTTNPQPPNSPSNPPASHLPTATVRDIPGWTPPPPGAAHSSTAGMNGSVQQELVVAINPGGPLRVTPDSVTVTLRREGHELVGDLGPIQLVDPRGTLAGWKVRAVLQGDDQGQVLVVPGHPTAVSGRQSEVTGARARTARGDEGVLLMSARPGGGGGTFTVDARVVFDPRGNDTDQSLTFSIIAS